MNYQTIDISLPVLASPAPGRLCLIDVPAAGVAANIENLWQDVRATAALLAAREPLLRHMLDELICAPATPAALVAAVLARRLGARDVDETTLRMLFADILNVHQTIMAQIEADLLAIRVRDPACPNALHALLNLKGFHALQTYRIAHVLWQCERKELALTLTSHAAATFAVDIHPAARIGSGVMLDHGTGIVIGETAVIEDDVSILQDVTLGGTGKEQGDRHPKIRSGVMIGAGAKILGNIEIGAMSKIAAGSVVLKDMPAYSTVVGIPGRVARHHRSESFPAFDMDQTL
jgi:serine O-acetyltransferase